MFGATADSGKFYSAYWISVPLNILLVQIDLLIVYLIQHQSIIKTFVLAQVVGSWELVRRHLGDIPTKNGPTFLLGAPAGVESIQINKNFKYQWGNIFNNINLQNFWSNWYLPHKMCWSYQLYSFCCLEVEISQQFRRSLVDIYHWKSTVARNQVYEWKKPAPSPLLANGLHHLNPRH